MFRIFRADGASAKTFCPDFFSRCRCSSPPTLDIELVGEELRQGQAISVFCTEHNLIEYLGIRAHEFVFVEPRCGSGFICPTHAPDYIRSYLN
jgi:hypothetical protein